MEGLLIYPMIVVTVFFNLALLVQRNKKDVYSLFIENHMPNVPATGIERFAKELWNLFARKRLPDRKI